MNKDQLIKLIFNAYNYDLDAAVNPSPTIDELLNLSTSQLWAIAIDLDILGDELLWIKLERVQSVLIWMTIGENYLKFSMLAMSLYIFNI